MEYRKIATIVLFMTAVVAATNHSLAAQESVTKECERPHALLFADAFADDDIGSSPAGWTVDDKYGQVEVISEPRLASGRAVRVIAPPGPEASSSQAVIVRTPLWGPAAETAHTIAIEYQFNWRGGSNGIYHYVTKHNSHRIILPTYSEKLLYKPDGPMMALAELKEGWNRVRLVANRESGEAFVYLNDMETPVAGPLPFRRPIDSWADTQFIMRLEANPQEPREMLYGDFRVWTLKDEIPSHAVGPPAEVPGPPPREVSFTASGDGVPRHLDWEGHLRPTVEAMTTHKERALAIPFYQALPISQGELYPSQLADATCGLRHGQEKCIPALVSPAALWPDGSIRWLTVDGVWPQHLPLDIAPDGGVPVHFDETMPAGYTITESPLPPVDSLVVREGEVHLLGRDEQTVAILTPQAAYIDIIEPKHILPDTVPDDERQYAWAEPLEAVNQEGLPHPLSLRIREQVIEQDNDLFTVYRLRGDGGAALPGAGVEWQLRVRIYRDIPVIRLQMAWGLHWDPEKYALTQAAWVASFSVPFTTASVPDVTPRFDLSSGPVETQSDPTGRGLVLHGADRVAESESPDSMWDVSLVETSDGRVGLVNAHAKSGAPPARYIGIGAPSFTRLGPNHMSINENSIVLASWSDHSGYALDLRSTATLDEFGMAASDVNASAVGLMRTMESSLVWGQSADDAAALARLEAQRDTLWLPSQQDIVTTGSLGPLSSDTFESNGEYFAGLNANVHFVLASRDRWRWNGFANFGDIRTNFSTGSNPERGLHPGRWALHGRYGWRKGAAEPYYGMWLTGLLLEERDIALAALDYALHVADIDVTHGSFFAPWSAETGGMHRRNKDHWSGSVQMQYTPSSGLYLAQWLTGHERFADALEEVRAYAGRQGGSGSAYAASAWIHRYMETHSSGDLRTARALLDEAASAWETRGTSATKPEDMWGNLDPNAQLSGLAALYMGNFRLPTNGIPTLIEFHEATHDPVYLEAIRASLQAHGIPPGSNPSLGNYYGLSYLLASGFTEEDIGTDLLQTARQGVAGLLAPSAIPPRDEWNYDTLVPFAIQTSATETTSIGWRAEYAPVVLRVFGHPPMRINAHSPRTGAVATDLLPVNLEWVNPSVAAGLETVTLTLNDDEPLYTGTALPAQGEVVIDTTKLDDGRHSLTIAAVHEQHGTFQHTVDFQVWNHWTLEQDMTPPVTKGWFGEVDFLQTERRSAGWAYATDNSEHFFGDPERLVRATDTTEYLIWETPQLIQVTMTLFIRLETDLTKALELAVSSTGDDWRTVAYQAEVDDGEHGWRRARVTLDFCDEPNLHWFRFVLSDALPKEAVQIGQVILTGYRTE
ncbi:MAG: hypothetical protein ACOX4G_07965 [Limnochordia bacterium]